MVFIAAHVFQRALLTNVLDPTLCSPAFWGAGMDQQLPLQAFMLCHASDG